MDNAFLRSSHHTRRSKAASFVLTDDHIKNIIRYDGTIWDDGIAVAIYLGLSGDDKLKLRDRHVIGLLSNPNHIDTQKVTWIDIGNCKGITDASLVFIADHCPQLKRLHVDRCNMSALPKAFGYKLKHLELLRLSNNNITTLPPSIANLVGTFTHFYIDGNPLQDPPLGVTKQGTLPTSMTNSPGTCTTFLIDDNSLKDPPLGVAQQKIKAMKRFNLELDYGFQISNQQKIVLVKAGKTSLLHALQGRPSPLTREKDRTIHVNHSKVCIPIAPVSEDRIYISFHDSDILASFYDCGGQEEYASGQTPFLTGSALYLLVVSAGDADYKESYLRFMTLLLTRAPNAVVQLIITKTDLITDSNDIEKIGQDVHAWIEKRIEDYSKGREDKRNIETDHATLLLQSRVLYISVMKDPEGVRNIIFDEIKAIAGDESNPPLLPTLHQKIPVRWGTLYSMIDELRDVGIEEMEYRKAEIFENKKRKDAEQKCKQAKELVHDMMKGKYDIPGEVHRNGKRAEWTDEEKSTYRKSGIYCRMEELCTFINEYCADVGKENGVEGINVRDAMVFLESQGDVYMVGDLVFLSPDVIGELMAKLVDHFLKYRVLGNDSDISRAVEDFVKEIDTGNEVNPHKKLMDGLKKFVKTGEIHHHKVLPFLWRDILPPRRASADDYDSIVRMFAESGVIICMGSSSENKEDPVPVVVYRPPSKPPPNDDELWPEACPQGLEQVTIHFEVNGDSVPPSLPPLLQPSCVTLTEEIVSMHG